MARLQRTIRREATTGGIGFITGADVSVRFLPADADHGIVFQRVDLADQPCVPASLDSLIPRQRRTGLSANGATVELVEHVLSALAGLQVDNCLVQLDAPETPGFDGSCQAAVDCLIEADFEEQDVYREVLVLDREYSLADDDGSTIQARPSGRSSMALTYQLDYGPTSPIYPQTYSVELTPETFVNEIAFARTFILESEVEALKAQGLGKRTTAKDLLVFSPDEIVDNSMRAADECARHKILDCIGDFALIGCDLHGYFSAWRTGHRMNHELMKAVRAAQLTTVNSSSEASAA
ncbi:MAG: UDP-3-O-acyl-N-acetylglucosamine deacetylase, partial [Planctomycetes bacterium]|nr:UDP-3-O-acyl-N-acetylglucosamine deacetylase [Planctomycetota bacterium]